jgi:hypothetical protein
MTEAKHSPLLILVAGPYRSNTNDDPARIAANYRRMNDVALLLFRRGHTPLTGEAVALPLMELAGSERMGDSAWNEIFHPMGRRLIAHVDAVLRLEGSSVGADEMVELARAAGKPVFFALAEVPD